MTETKKLGWGVMGCGFIGKKQIAAIENAELGYVAAIASRSTEKLEPYAKETGLDINKVKLIKGYENLLKEETVEVVYIALPTGVKMEWIEASAKAGKHIVFEKPMMSAEEVKKVIEICKKHNVHCMDNTMWVHHTRTEEIRDTYLNKSKQAKGSIDRILNIRASFHVGLLYFDKPYENIRFDTKKEPMGSLGDLGWYTIRGILFGFGYELPEKVTAIAVRDENTNAIITCTATLMYPDGRTGVMTANFSDFYFMQKLELISRNNIISIPDFVIPIHEDKTIFLEQPKHQKSTYSVMNQDGTTKNVELPPCDQTVNLVNRFAKDVQGGGDANWREETLKVMKVMDAVFASLEDGGKLIKVEQ